MNNKQESIIESALKLFSINGYGSTTTAEIAKEAKVSVGTLFNYYPTKKILVNELYLYANRSYCDYTKNLEEKHDFKKGMIELWGRCIDFALDNQNLFRFIILFRNSPVITDETVKQIEDESIFFENVYNKFRKRNEVKMYYDLFSYVMFGCLVETLEFIEKNPDKDINHIKEVSFDYLWDGVNP